MSQVETDTRSRLLESASEVFVEKGFHEATVQEICDRASANIAAVNYYYGGKEALYHAVWTQAFELTARAFPLDGNVPEDASPEVRLRALVAAFLSRVFSDGPPGWFPRLQVHEMSHPTSSMLERFETTLRPSLDYVFKVVQQVAGVELPEERLQACAFSVVSQCIFYGFTRPVQEHRRQGRKITKAELEQLADHIATFSLTGLRAATNDARKGTG